MVKTYPIPPLDLDANEATDTDKDVDSSGQNSTPISQSVFPRQISKLVPQEAWAITGLFPIKIYTSFVR